MLECAWAHVDRIVLESLLDAESSLPDGDAKAVLEQVRDVYVLDILHTHSGWYQEQNLLTGTRSKAARAALNDLADSLGPWTETLVDAFAIPENLTSVPLLTVDDEMVPRAKTNPAAGTSSSGAAS
jgi:acyl-CoA oxidase